MIPIKYRNFFLILIITLLILLSKNKLYFQYSQCYGEQVKQERDSIAIYNVRPNDNLTRIARKFYSQTDAFPLSIFTSQIRGLNNISNNTIRIGQKLKIPLSRGTSLLEKIQPDTIRGIYIQPYYLNSAKAIEIVKHYKETNCNAIVVDFKNMRGELFYPSKNEIAQQVNIISLVISHPEKMISFCHKHNISLIARFVVFHDIAIANAFQEWTPIADTTRKQSVSDDEKKWLNPYLPEVQAYQLALLKEVLSFGVDEIQLDYIRFPTESKYTDRSFSLPDSVKREDVIVDFLRKVRILTDEYNTKLSADVFGIIAFQRSVDIASTGQNIKRMAKYLDRINPMIYPSHFFGRFEGKKYPGKEPYYFVHQTCKRLKGICPASLKVSPFLQAFSLWHSQFNPAYLLSQLQALKDCDITDGFLLWNAASKYEKSWPALKLWNTGTKYIPLENNDY